MSCNDDKGFHQQRNDTFDQVIAFVDAHIRATAPAVLLNFSEIAMDQLRESSRRESWELFLNGVRYLKDGAPDNKPGSMPEALARMSLRSGAFAAAIRIRPPQFEPVYFSVEYATGQEAALFFCQRLVAAAEMDLAKSAQIIRQKIAQEKPAGAFGVDIADPVSLQALKRQMVFSFNVLAETYGQTCRDFKAALPVIAPSSPAGPAFD